MLRPTLPVLALVSVVFLAIAGSLVALGLWFHPRAPQVVRLLPPGGTLAYLDLEPLRIAGMLDAEGAGEGASPDYAAFERASGFDFERDLDEVACSLNGPPLRPVQTTCVLEGIFGAQFVAYLRNQAERRQELGHGIEAYQFPGWAQPQRPMYVVPLDSTRILATNADPAAALGWTRRWWNPTPALWRVRAWSPLPIAYAALDASGRWDNGQPPWQGTKTVQASVLAPFSSGLRLEGEEQTGDASAAEADREWLQQNLNTVRELLPAGRADPGQLPGLGALLGQVQLRVQGSRLEFSLQLDAATVRQWQQALHAP